MGPHSEKWKLKLNKKTTCQKGVLIGSSEVAIPIRALEKVENKSNRNYASFKQSIIQIKSEKFQQAINNVKCNAEKQKNIRVTHIQKSVSAKPTRCWYEKLRR